MANNSAKNEVAEKILSKVLGEYYQGTPEQFIHAFLGDVKIPKKVKSVLGGTTWTSVDGLAAYADQSQVVAEAGKHDWLYPAEEIKSLEHLNELIARSDFMQGSRIHDSTDIHHSDDIGKSRHVYSSQNIIESSNTVHCSWIWNSEFLLGCARSGNSTFCIGSVEAVNSSNSYRVYGSHKIVDSMFIKSSYDLQDCLFCSHLQHKQYCIANMQYDKEAYFKLKDMILKELF